MNPKPPLQRNVRILVIDDQENIHDDYRKIVGPRETRAAALDAAAAEFFGEEPAVAEEPDLGFELDSAFQGEDGYRMVQQAIEQGRPYAMAFVDIRMPPGWDGVETVQRIWEIDTEILMSPPRFRVVAAPATCCFATAVRNSAFFCQTPGRKTPRFGPSVPARRLPTCPLPAANER